MKKLVLVLLAMLCVGAVSAKQFENPMLNLTVPSGLEQGEMYLVIGHKFLQTLYHDSTASYDLKNDFFAVLNYGSNVKIGLRGMIWQGIEANVAYVSKHREKIAGLSYVLKTPDIGFITQMDIQFINFQDMPADINPVKQNLFYLLSVESIPFLDDRVAVGVNAGYDSLEKQAGLGIGISVETIRHFRLLADYYPVINPAGGRTTGCYGFGVKIDTNGHQFVIKAGNSDEIGSRDLMHGTTNNNMYIGFDIMRLISF